MLIEPHRIVIDHLNLGPGRGGVRQLRCEVIGFVRPLAGGRRAITNAIAELDDLVFERFRRGELELEPAALHKRASALIQLADDALIAEVYHPDHILRDVICRELIARGLFDRGLFAIGEFATNARPQAIQLMQAGARGGRAMR